ncbi:MAG: alpha/beta fold hydrolase [Marinicella sp.]|nr:alpha/beta fold hydrolase [Xanthomonadales bacterium]
MFKDFTIKVPSFQLESGEDSGDLEVACCLYGALDKPIVVVLGGISASRWALDCPNNSRAGWWQGVLGQSDVLSCEHCCLLTFEYFSFSENIINPPVLTPADQATLLSHIQNTLNLPQFHAVIGSSFGGMVALAFAALFPNALRHLVCLAAADKSSVKSQALRKIQRDIINLGSQFAVDSQSQQQFVALARALAMVGYRGEEEFEQRFQNPIPGTALQQVTSYLTHNSERFAAQFSASRYAQLSRSIDYHQVDVSLITANTLLIGFTSDQMVPTKFINNMGNNITGSCQIHLLDSLYGHDGFLLEVKQLTAIFNTFFREHSHDYIERNHRCASGY